MKHAIILFSDELFVRINFRQDNSRVKLSLRTLLLSLLFVVINNKTPGAFELSAAELKKYFSEDVL